MPHWTPPNRGVSQPLTHLPSGGATPTGPSMGMQFRVAPTDGGTSVPRTGLSKSADPAGGGKGDRRNVPLGERSGPHGAVQVRRVFTNHPAAASTGRSVRRLPSAFGPQENFCSEAASTGRG